MSKAPTLLPTYYLTYLTLAKGVVDSHELNHNRGDRAHMGDDRMESAVAIGLSFVIRCTGCLTYPMDLSEESDIGDVR